MSGSVMLVNTMQIDGEKLEEFRESVESSIAFVEANGPQLLVEIYIDEDTMRAYSFQFYRDSESILSHWQLSDPYIRNVMEHSTVQRLDVYGQPTDEVMAGIQSFAQHGVTVTMTPHFTGFARFQANEQAEPAVTT